MAETVPPPRSSRSLRRWLITAILLGLIVLLGGYFRAINLADWDGNTDHHPDERFMRYTVNNLRVPDDWRTYFVSTCPTPVPEPRNPGEPPDKWEPSELSGCSTLNPRNFVSWSSVYVYGTLPTTLTRVIAEWTNRADLEGVLMTGRWLSVSLDLVALVALFTLATTLYGRRVGLLAAALYAGAVMPIQQSHFFTVDNFAVGFGTLALLFTTRLGRTGRWRDAILSGLCIAAAVASKINMAALVGLVFVALAQVAWTRFRAAAPTSAEQPSSSIVASMSRIALLLIVTGLVTFAAFRVFQPDAFAGPNIWNIRPEARFLEQLKQARFTADGTIDLPSSIQWADRTPWLFPWQNMVLWGMGAPLGLAAWIAWAWAGWQMFARRRLTHLAPWIWIAVYFAWQGQQFVTTMRYFLPIYPPLIMFAAWGLAQLWTIGQRRSEIRAAQQWPVARILRSRRVPLIVTLLVLLGTWSWAWAYTRIYTRPYTRVAAANWLQQVAPDGAATTWELWDDLLPAPPAYNQIATYPYAEEEPLKYLGGVSGTDAQEIKAGLIDQLAQADYVFLMSPRVFASVERVPERYPVILRYYQALFDGSLGFEFAGAFRSEPTLFNIPISDLGADEAFWVYDHPPVLAFRRTENFSPDRARTLLTQDVAWDEIYRGLRPAQMNQAPTALLLTERAWNALQAADTRFLFNGLNGIPALILWLLAIELLGAAAYGLLLRVRLPLPGRGIGLARIVGLLSFAGVPALLGATQRVPIGRPLLLVWYGLLALGGGWLLVRDRARLHEMIRTHRRALIATNLLYAGVFVVGAAYVRGLGDPSTTTTARWTALLRAATLPPYDPLFAGGHDPQPYAAQLPFALLDKLLGVLPLTALKLALPTALALVASAVWSAVSQWREQQPAPIVSDEQAAHIRAANNRRWNWRSLIPVITVLLALIPGLPRGNFVQTTLVGALATYQLAPLGLAMFAAAALALSPALARAQSRLTIMVVQVLLALPLLFVRGHSVWAFVAVAIVVSALVWSRSAGSFRRRLLVIVPPLLAAIVLGYGFSWSIGAGTAPLSALGSGGLLLALALPLLVIIGFTVIAGARLAERNLLLVALVVFVGWSTLSMALNFGIALLAVPLLMIGVWLAVQAWLPLHENRRSARSGAIFTALAAAMLLLIVAGLALSDRLSADVPALLAVVSVLLAIAAGWALPAIALAARTSRTLPLDRRRIVGGAVIGLLAIGLGLGGAAARNLSAAEAPATSPAVQAAARWLAANTRGTPVVATAAQFTASALTGATGLPTLIGGVDEERRVRNIVQPAVGGVIDGRQRAIEAIYGGDVERAATALRTYYVGYVLLGPDEQAFGGSGAGAALDALVQRGTLQQVYDQDGVRIFAATPPTATPPFVHRDVQLELPPTKTLMLAQPVDQLPAVNEYAWNTAATRYQWLGVALWLLLLEALGLLAWPLVARIFPRWHDRGWGVSKIVGLIVWGYAVWLPVSLGLWIFNWWALVFGALALGLGAWLLGVRGKQPLRDLAPAPQSLLRSELWFLLAFGLWTLIRAANPDVWHPFFGGEKPFEFGFLNAILRSPVLPPYDPFYSDGIINYYYYGLYLVALPIKATGIDPAIGFNLAVATIFALMTTAALAIGRELTGRWRYGVFANLLLVGIGTAASAFAVQESRGIQPVLDALQGGLSGFSDRLGWWFWGPSRVIPFTINEFPLFSFLFADLHPHMIGLPITLLAIACAIELVQRDGVRWGVLALSALTLGALAIANSWDAPTYALVIGGALVGRAWRRRDDRVSWRVVLRVALAGLLAAGTTLVGVALYTPFFVQFRAMVGGIGVVRGNDTVLQYALVYGPLLLLAISMFGSVGLLLLKQAEARRRVFVQAGTIAGLLLVGLLLTSARAQAEPTLQINWALRGLLLLLALTGIALALVVRLRDFEWLPLWLITVGFLVALGVQFVFVRDHLAGGDYERMNTVFKFGLQQWTLWAIGGAAAMPVIIRVLRRNDLVSGVWIGLLALALAPGLLYPLAGIPSRLGTRFDRAQGLTLDGLAFMARGTYNYEDQPIALSADGAAIAWLKQNIAGTPIVATSGLEFYRAYGVRISANTGLPTVVSELHENEQRPPAEVDRRVRDMQTFFNTPDVQTALQLIAKYHIEYVYIGPIERRAYSGGMAKFEQMRGSALEAVYDQNDVQIYRVKPDALAGIAVDQRAPEAAAPVSDAQTAALEAQVAANPDDSASAFGLAQRYIELNRLEDAARVLEAATAQRPNDVPMYHLLGDVEAQLGRADEAIAAWQHAADVQRTASNVNKLGQGLVQLGRYADAERVLNEALALDPAFPDAHFFLGELYRTRNEAGDRERAVAAYQRYLAAAPADAPWRELAQAHVRELER